MRGHALHCVSRAEYRAHRAVFAFSMECFFVTGYLLRALIELAASSPLSHSRLYVSVYFNLVLDVKLEFNCSRKSNGPN